MRKKQHILITGSKKVGKTTLINRIIDNTYHGVKSYAAFTDDKMPDGVIMSNSVDRESKNIAVRGDKRMVPLDGVIEDFGVSCLKKVLESSRENAYIDEIGYLESSCSKYCEYVYKLFSKKNVVAAIRKEEIPFLENIKKLSDCVVIDLDNDTKVGCVVLAAGNSSRFGNNKLLAKIGGKTLFEHTLENIPMDRFEKVLVLTAYDEVQEICSKYGVECKIIPSVSKSYTVIEGIKAMNDMDGCMFVVSDQPFMKTSTLLKLVESFRSNNQFIHRIGFDKIAGNPVVFPKKHFEKLLSRKDDSGGRDVIKENKLSIVQIECQEERELMDIDRMDDLFFTY